MDLDRLSAMRLFVRITQCGTFAQAADSMGISSATATERIGRLEAELRAKLLNRTTRRVSLTPEGERYLAVCRSAIDDLDAVERSIAGDAKLRRGPVTISANVGVFRSILLPGVAAFAEAHPEIRLQILISDGRADFVRDGVDFAVRVGGLEDQDLIVRRIGEPWRVTVASPSYLARYGEPETPDDLTNHRLLDFLLPKTARSLAWDFADTGGLRHASFNGPLAVNDAEARVRFAEDGAGIAQTMCFLAVRGIREGRLVRLLRRWETAAPAISILYPRNRHMPARVKAAIDFATETIAAELKMSAGILANQGSRGRTLGIRKGDPASRRDRRGPQGK